jgi:hypothetical protein
MGLQSAAANPENNRKFNVKVFDREQSYDMAMLQEASGYVCISKQFLHTERNKCFPFAQSNS